MIKIIAKREDKLVKILSDESRLPFSVISKKLSDKQVMINGRRTKENEDIFSGDEIIIFAEEIKTEIKTVYEDSNILVAIKPKGIETTSAKERSFEKQVKEKFPYIKACHRLDRNTEGLVIFSKNEEAEKEILKAFKDSKIEKIYLALVFGRPKKQEKFTSYLRKNSEASTVMIFDNPVKGAEKIITEYKQIKQNGEINALEVTLREGGKTHQIRAHLAYNKLPIVGDGKYGNSELNKKYKVKNQELYAKKIVFHLNGALAYLNDIKFEYEPKIKF